MEESFDQVEGVISTISGYSGGHLKNPKYADVIYTDSGHVEAIEVTYDSAKIDYQKLLDIYWKNIDPFDANGQFCDKGSQYRPGIFYHDDEQRRLAQEAKADVDGAKTFGEEIVTEITMASTFYPAEDYHQDFARRNPNQPYITHVAKPKLEKLHAAFPEMLKT